MMLAIYRPTPAAREQVPTISVVDESGPITAAMVEAGTQALREWFPDSCDGGDYDRDAVRAILLAALAAE